MRRRIFLYILKEHFLPFGGGIIVIILILLFDRVFDLLDLIITKGVGLKTVLEILYLSLPFMLALCIPMAVLISVIVSYGRMSSDNEILALKALGVDNWQILFPSLIFGIFWTIADIIHSSSIMPEANFKLKNLLLDISIKKPSYELEEKIFKRFENYLFYSEKIDKKYNKLTNVIIEENNEGRFTLIVAREGDMIPQRDEYIYLILQDGEIYELSGSRKEILRKIKFDSYRVIIPMDTKLVRRERDYRSDREMSLKMLLLELSKLKRELRSIRDKKSLRYEILKKRENQLMVEVHKKFSVPFAAISFVLVGFTTGLVLKKGGYGPAFGASFLIFTFYYILIISTEELADRAIIDPSFVWLPNLILALIGIYGIKRY